VILPGKCFGAGYALNPVGSILVSIGSGLCVPESRLLDIDGDIDADFIKVTEGEFGRGQPVLSSAARIDESHLFILLKDALIAAQKPLADRHLRFWFTLSGCQVVVVQR
jgi:hypothetical protein